MKNNIFFYKKNFKLTKKNTFNNVFHIRHFSTILYSVLKEVTFQKTGLLKKKFFHDFKTWNDIISRLL